MSSVFQSCKKSSSNEFLSHSGVAQVCYESGGVQEWSMNQVFLEERLWTMYPLHTGNCKTSLLLREEWIQIEIRRCPEQRLGIEVRYTSSRLIVLIRVINDCVLEDFATDMCMLDHENLEDDILELLENQNTLPYGCSHKYPTEWLLKIILRTANCNDHYDPPHNLDMSSASAKIQSFHLQWCF